MNKNEKKYSAILIWGKDAINESEKYSIPNELTQLKSALNTKLSCVDFETKEELKAYLKGVDDMCGWYDYRIISEDSCSSQI